MKIAICALACVLLAPSCSPPEDGMYTARQEITYSLYGGQFTAEGREKIDEAFQQWSLATVTYMKFTSVSQNGDWRFVHKDELTGGYSISCDGGVIRLSGDYFEVSGTSEAIKAIGFCLFYVERSPADHSECITIGDVAEFRANPANDSIPIEATCEKI
jgi:hypothetical protein